MEQQNFTDTQTQINIKSKQVPKQSVKIGKKITADKSHEYQLNFGKQKQNVMIVIFMLKKTSRDTINQFFILITIKRRKTDKFRFRDFCKFFFKNLNEEHEITHHIGNNSPKKFLGERKTSYSFHIYNNVDDEKNMIFPSYSLIKKLLPN